MYQSQLVQTAIACFAASVNFCTVHHAHLRLLCLSEVCNNCSLYDKSHADFYGQFAADECLVLPNFNDFVADLCTLGCASDF